MSKKHARRKGLGKFNRMRHWSGANKSVLSEYGQRIHSLQRGEIVQVLPDNKVQTLMNHYQDVKIPMVLPARGHQIPEERDPCPPFIRVLLRLWQTERHQGVDQFHHIKMHHPKYGNLKLFFHANEYIWQQDRTGWFSITYEGKRAAILAYDRNRVIWTNRL